MKRKFFLSLLLISSMISYADDWSRLGYKGIGTKSTISDNSGYGGYDSEKYIFDISGKLLEITSNRYGSNFSAKSLTPTSTGFSGSCETNDVDGKITITKGEKGITKIFVKYGTGSFTISNTYDSEGKLSKKVYDATWYEKEEITYESNIGSELNRFSKNQNSTLNKYGNRQQENVEKYKKKMESAMARGDMNAYKKAYDEYMKASSSNVDDYMNESNRNVNSYMSNARAGIKTKKVKHTEHRVYTFSDYVFDDFGNWKTRKVSTENENFEDCQTIDYDPEYVSQFYWERLEKEGNLQKIEAFFLNPITTSKYKELASNYWNGHVLDEVAQKYNNNNDTLCCMTKKAIISDVVKEQALEIVRNNVFNNNVMAERDYVRVFRMKDLQCQNVTVFNDNYRQKIEVRSQELRADSIAFLINKAKQEFESANYQQALATSKGIQLIDPSNETAADLCQESSYRIILFKESNNSISESDYVSFIDEYKTSNHVPEMQNNRALFASSLFNIETPDRELERVYALPTDEPTHKIVRKRYKKWKYRINRGNFVHVGVGGEYALGAANSVASGELLLRFGYTVNIVNVVTGIKYNYLTSTSQAFKTPKEAGKAYFERQYLSVPLMLNFNLKHGYNGCTYIGVGTDINITSLSSKLRDVEDVTEKEFGNNKLSFTPRVAFGGRFFGIELELFASYDSSNPFNTEFIKAYNMNNGQNIKTVCDENSFKKQIEDDSFSSKLRGGLALRLWF